LELVHLQLPITLVYYLPHCVILSVTSMSCAYCNSN
jgi:hypothetical protein